MISPQLSVDIGHYCFLGGPQRKTHFDIFSQNSREKTTDSLVEKLPKLSGQKARQSDAFGQTFRLVSLCQREIHRSHAQIADVFLAFQGAETPIVQLKMLLIRPLQVYQVFSSLIGVIYLQSVVLLVLVK